MEAFAQPDLRTVAQQILGLAVAGPVVVQVRRTALQVDVDLSAQRRPDGICHLRGAHVVVADVEDLPADHAGGRGQHCHEAVNGIRQMHVSAALQALVVQGDLPQPKRTQDHRMDHEIQSHARTAPMDLPQAHDRWRKSGRRHGKNGGLRHQTVLCLVREWPDRRGLGRFLQAGEAVDTAATDKQVAGDAATARQLRQADLRAVVHRIRTGRIRRGRQFAGPPGQIDHRLHAGQVAAVQRAGVHAADLQPRMVEQIRQPLLPEDHAVHRGDRVPPLQQRTNQRRPDVASGAGDQNVLRAVHHVRAGKWEARRYVSASLQDCAASATACGPPEHGLFPKTRTR